MVYPFSYWIAMFTTLMANMSECRHVLNFVSALKTGAKPRNNGDVWTYNGALGTPLWPLRYSQCAGLRQSPVDIDTAKVTLDTVHLTPFMLNGYQQPFRNNEIKNAGKTVQIYFNDTVGRRYIADGGLPGHYVLHSLHFHWGSVDGRGSEHTINGKQFPMEMHVVHYNKKHGTYQSAVGKRDGVAVLAFMFKTGHFNPYIKNITDCFYAVPLPDYSSLMAELHLSKLMPHHVERFWRYKGSATTPPCGENVIWTVFADPIEISKHQLQLFRTALYTKARQPITNNYREVQPLNGRQIFGSHPSISAQSAAHSMAPYHRPQTKFDPQQQLEFLDELMAMFS